MLSNLRLYIYYKLHTFVSVPANPCSLKPCKNGGTCVRGRSVAGYSCQCRVGYSGQNCEKGRLYTGLWFSKIHYSIVSSNCYRSQMWTEPTIHWLCQPLPNQLRQFIPGLHRIMQARHLLRM